MFKIEDVPIPTDLAPVRRGPGRPRKVKPCHNSEHFWTQHGEEDKCSKCGDYFPCRGECCHVDCLEAKSLPIPDWIGLVTEFTNPIITQDLIAEEPYLDHTSEYEPQDQEPDV